MDVLIRETLQKMMIMSVGRVSFSGLAKLPAAMVLIAGFGVASIVTEASAVIRQDLRIQRPSIVDQRFDDPLALRSAKNPIQVTIDLGASGGVPRIPEGGLQAVVAALNAHPRRLVTIDFANAPLRFSRLSRATRDRLLEKSGPDVVRRYDDFLAGQVLELLEGVREVLPGAPLSVRGVPFEGTGPGVRRENHRYAEVISRLDAFVVDRKIMVADSTDESSVIGRAFPIAFELRDGRPIFYRLNLRWRMAIDQARIDSSQRVASRPSASPADSTAPESVVDGGLALASPMNEQSVNEQLRTVDKPASRGGGKIRGGSATPRGGGGGGSQAGPGQVASAGSPLSEDFETSEVPATEESTESNEGTASGNTDSDEPTDTSGSRSDESDDSEEADDSDGADSDASDDSDGADSDASDDSDGADSDASDDSDGADSDASDDSDAGDLDEADDSEAADPWDPGDEIDDSENSGSDDAGTDEPEEPGDVEDSGDAPSGGGDVPSDDGSDSSDDQEDAGGEYFRGPMQGIGEGPIDFWEPHGVFQALLDGTPDGGILDVRGRGFFVRPGEVFRVNDKAMRILGGHFTGASELDWSPIGDHLFEAPVDLTQLADYRLLLIDPNSETWPLSAQRPAPPPVRHFDRFTYNSNWWVVNAQSQDIDNGVVLTVDGPDSIGSAIVGLRIDDPVMRAAVTAAVGDDQPATISLMYHAGPNVIETNKIASWSPETGTLMFDGIGSLTYNKYLRFCLSGSSSHLSSPGEYAIDLAMNRVIYWPVNGDPDQARLPMTDQVFRVDDVDIEFVNSTFTGNLTAPSGAGMISSTLDPPSRIKMLGCHMHSCRLGISNAKVDIDQSVIEHSTDRGVSVTDGSKITRSVIRHIQNKSGIIVMCDGTGPAGEVEQSIIRDNYFHMPASAHGQGLSLYKDAWQNALVEHNIFDDCERAFAFQPESNAAKRRTDSHALVFANNLVIYDDEADGLPGGQPVISFNGALDTHLPLDTSQTVRFCHNTILAREGVIADPMSFTLWSVDLRKLVRADVKVESNVTGLISASSQGDEIGSLPHWRFGNLGLLSRWGASYGEYDLPSPTEIDEVFNWESFEVDGYARTAASDGGPVGIRWQAIPSAASLKMLGPDWSSVYPAEQLPAAPLLGWVYFNEDRR